MECFLVQHAEAKPKEADPDRSLTEAGVEAAKRMSDWAGRAGVEVYEIRHSGKTRAEQTASILAQKLEPRAGVAAVSGIDPLDDPTPLAAELHSRAESVMLVGHLPFLSRLTGLLLAGDPERPVVAFENAGIVCLRRSQDRWSLCWAVVPRVLDAG